MTGPEGYEFERYEFERYEQYDDDPNPYHGTYSDDSEEIDLDPSSWRDPYSYGGDL